MAWLVQCYLPEGDAKKQSQGHGLISFDSTEPKFSAHKATAIGLAAPFLKLQARRNMGDWGGAVAPPLFLEIIESYSCTYCFEAKT